MQYGHGSHTKKGEKYEGNGVKVIVYADDVVIWGKNEIGLNEQLNFWNSQMKEVDYTLT